MKRCVKYMKTHWEIPGSQNCRALFLPRQIAADLRRPHPPPKHQECLSEWPCKMLAPAWHQRAGAAGSRKRSVLLCSSSSFVSKSTSVPRTRTFYTSVHVHAVDSRHWTLCCKRRCAGKGCDLVHAYIHIHDQNMQKYTFYDESEYIFGVWRPFGWFSQLQMNVWMLSCLSLGLMFGLGQGWGFGFSYDD